LLLVSANRVAMHRVLEPLELSVELVEPPFELLDARFLNGQRPPAQSSEHPHAF
jgi:hypothetical protein